MKALLSKMGKILSVPLCDREEILDALAHEFRDGFAELSARADGLLSGRHFIFSRYGRELYPCFPWETDASRVPGCITSIKEGRPIASVDSTCVLLGETQDGSLYAARAGVGISSRKSLRKFVQLGPMIIYLSGDGLSGLKTQFTELALDAMLADHGIAERVIRNTVERKVVDSLLASEDEVFVMVDGSLKHPLGSFTQQPYSRRNPSTCLVGFSKSSSLIFSEAAAGAVSRAENPAYFTLEEGPVSTVLAKFSPDGLVFRLDLSAPAQPVHVVLGRMLGNDVFTAGYPESLKLAHHLSVFTKAEGAALKAYVTKRFRLRELPTFNLRRIILGSLGGA